MRAFLILAFAIVVMGGCNEGSTPTSTWASNLTCGLPSGDAPAERPVDPCRDGTLVLGPVVFERGHGGPTTKTRSFTIPGELPACVSIQSRGSDRQQVAGSSITLDGQRIAGPADFGQNVATLERRQVLAAGNHILAAQLRGPPTTRAEISIFVGGNGTRHGLVTSDHLELFNLFADPRTFHGDVEPTQLTARGTALALPGLPSSINTFRVRWRFEILSVASCTPVRTLAGETILGPAATFAPQASWDGLDTAGAEAPEGTYGYRLLADLVRISPNGSTVIDSLATAVQTVELDRIEGWVDFHTHPMSHLGFGGKAMYGAPDTGLLMPAGSVGCNDDPVRASTPAEALGNCNGPHGGWGAFDNPCGDFLRAFLVNLVDADFKHGGALALDHYHEGYPNFRDWPHQTSLLHQQMWWQWMQRAHDGGQRVVVALAVNSELLAEILNGNRPFDDRSVAELQIAETIRLVEQHPEFMEIARSSADVLRIAASGKLAVVLGVEIDRIGNFGVNSAPSEAAIRDEIRHLYALGVRYVFPVHLVDNAFGGAAVYHPLFSFANKRANGYHFHVETSPDPNVLYNGAALADFLPFSPAITYVLTLIGLEQLRDALVAIGLAPAPCEDFPCVGLVRCCSSFAELTDILAPSTDLDGYFLVNPGHVNTLGLTARGEIAIDEMMKLGMLIDLDHMSEKTMRRVITIAEGTATVAGAGYPLMFGHTALRGLRCGEDAHCSERSPSSELLQRVAALGGMVGTGSAHASPISFIDTYLHLQALMGPDSVGIGTDANGFEMLPTTRLSEDEECVPNPTASETFYNAFIPTLPANTPRKSQIMGSTREWDYFTECGVAHYGMMPEFLFDVRTRHGDGGAQVYAGMMRSTRGLVRMWQRVEAVSAQLP